MVIIEPIKNQYLTALKERQQIIDKLNEIIRGLNALDFDDLTTIHAELVAIRESLQTQNTAITEINNSIGQIESELTSFDNRLITLNTNIENTESHLTSFENDTALNLQSKVNKNGDIMTGNLGIPTTETGSRNNLAVNGERLQNDLDNYAPMVRNTGNRTVYGDSIWKSKSYYEQTTPSTSIWVKNTTLNIGDSSIYINIMGAQDKSANSLGYIQWITQENGVAILRVHVRNSNGTFKAVDVAKGDVIQ